MMDFQGVLLDLDGTLIDSETLHEQVDLAVFDACGLTIPAALWPTFKGRTSASVFTDVHARYGGSMTPEAMLALKRRLFAGRIGEITVLEGAPEMVEALHARGTPVALVTSTERVLVEAILEKHPFRFDAVITADEVERPKPDPEPYLRGAQALGLDAAQCLVVEDATSGIASAKAAGCAVAALVGSFSREALEQTPADAVLDTLAEVQGWLTSRLPSPV